MPNTGKPSGGCHACRRMKVKCDQQRPGCARCGRAGRVCPGYRDDPSIFRSMNYLSDGTAEQSQPRRRRSGQGSASRSPLGRGDLSPYAATASPPQDPRSRSPNKPRSPQEEMAESSWQVGRVEERPALSPIISTSWEDQAVCFYFSEWTLQPQEHLGAAGYLEFLPDLINEEAHVIYLTDALKAVALAAMGNRSCVMHLLEEARKAYGRALSQVNVAIGNEEQAKSDATLAAVLLLGQYEIISADKPTSELWQSHGKGQAALLRLRGPDQFKTARGCSLFRVVQAGMQLIDMGRNEGANFAVAPDQYPDDIYQNELGRTLGNFSRHISVVLGEVHDLLRNELYQSVPIWATQASNLVSRCLALTDQMDSWRDRERSALNYRIWQAPGLHPAQGALNPSPGGSGDSSILFPQIIYIFPDLSSAGLWVVFWAARLGLLKAIFRLVYRLQQANIATPADLSLSELQVKLARCMQDVLACVPYLLGEISEDGALRLGGTGKSIGAFYLLWPLHIVGLAAQESGQMESFWWVMGRLTYIGNVYGIKQAHVLRDYRMANLAV